MKRIFKSLVLVIGVLAGLFAGTASAAGPSDAELQRYNLEYCAEVGHSYRMLQQGYEMPAKRARIIRSEMKRCKEVRAAYLKIHPPGSIAVGVSNAVSLH
jgi:hypothetical protein